MNIFVVVHLEQFQKWSQIFSNSKEEYARDF